jgi:hypothetical protein
MSEPLSYLMEDNDEASMFLAGLLCSVIYGEQFGAVQGHISSRELH